MHNGNVSAKAHKVSVDFVLQPNKQRVLLDILRKYGQLELAELAALLTLPAAYLDDVFEGREFLHEKEAARLLEYFCICCGQ